MNIFEQIESGDHEQIIFCSNPSVGLKAIIAVHNTTLGPALGGTRMWTYATDDEALTDVLRLSRGMTYKAAVAGLNLGGGKAVIIGDSRTGKNEALFRAYGRYVEGLAGRYITAEDVGTDVRDMEWVRMETKYVTGISRAVGGSGDPSPVTALGTYVGMKACVKQQTGNDSLSGKKIVVQGAGHVASYLVRHLVKEGAKVYVTDIFKQKVDALCKETGATYVDPEKVFDIECDIFSPAALGGVINDETIPKLKCSIVAGCANNQLGNESRHAPALQKRNILYAPDYVINAGGLINVANELEGYSQERALMQAEGVYDILWNVFELAKRENVLTTDASNRIAEERIRKIGQIRNVYASTSQFSGRLGELSQRR